jgi:hypothetical protein
MAPASATTAGGGTVAREAARRRTFAIISHPDAGKTTLTEKLLLYGGAVPGHRDFSEDTLRVLALLVLALSASISGGYAGGLIALIALSLTTVGLGWRWRADTDSMRDHPLATMRLAHETI